MSTSGLLSGFKRIITNPRAPVVGVIVAGLIAITGGAAFAARSASEHFATAAFDKLGGNSDDILATIADKVVEKISKKGGTLDSAQGELVSQLADMAGKKFGNINAGKLVSDVRGQVVAAGLDKLQGISTDAIVANVTSALISQASALLDNVDVSAIAKGAITDVVKSLNLEKLVKQKIDSIDVQKLVNDAVAKQLGGGSSGGGGLGALLGLLGNR